MLKKIVFYAFSVIHLFSQICHHVNSAECKHIKGTTHNVKKFSLAAHFWKIRLHRVRENEQHRIGLKHEMTKLCCCSKMCSKMKFWNTPKSKTIPPNLIKDWRIMTNELVKVTKGVSSAWYFLIAWYCTDTILE